jgi:REP element-mobilizing transposase RayT
MCRTRRVEVRSGRHHVRTLVSVPPQVSLSKPVQKIKGENSEKLQREFLVLRK